MKKVVFAFAFMLIGSFAFASEIESLEIVNKDSNETKMVEKVETVSYGMKVELPWCLEYHVIYASGEIYHSWYELKEGSDCGFTAHWL